MIKKSTRDSILSILKTSLRINKKLNDVFKKYEISEQQFNILRILRGQRGKPSSLKTIQKRMVHLMSNTTRLVDKLILKDFVSRETCKFNRRKIDIFITDKGLKFLNEINPIIDKSEELMTTNLSEEEKNILTKLLNKIAV
ncbi:MAG: MarR family transcriptional regulator [Flavobacteriaceae bacterium]|jgi:DNA-binding MarR family transcriptional regulator|nr:MarR family transcriptional regulator [Flavobacteriaceae bacterium]|tara:strand:- start:626 stop:1048 length:423 start_codon:yes stop_codon:yes gene_type:complete